MLRLYLIVIKSKPSPHFFRATKRVLLGLPCGRHRRLTGLRSPTVRNKNRREIASHPLLLLCLYDAFKAETYLCRRKASQDFYIFRGRVSANSSNFRQKPHFALNFISQLKAHAVFQTPCSHLFRPHRTPF